MIKYAHYFYDYFKSFGWSDTTSKYLNMLILLVIAFIVVLIIDVVVRKLLRAVFYKIAVRTKSNFDDLLITNNVPRNIAHLPALYIGKVALQFIFRDFNYLQLITEKGIRVAGIILGLWIVRSILNTLKQHFKTLARLKDKPIDSYIQVFMIFAWTVGMIMALAVITNISMWEFATGFGAASAVILLIFKDTILGFVASIQVAINDIIRIGDWVTFEKYGADGDVIEINLATVKIQNFDNTITTIPTYGMISDSFKNWRGMTNSSGRRIKRHLLIKQSSIKYLTPEDIKKLKSITLITDYLITKETKINYYNTSKNIDKSLLINGKNLTNIGVFRKFLEAYLEQHSAINKNMLLMVRQLQPTTQGIPLEIYCFSEDKRWQNYEYVMSDLFDHFLAAVPYFDLELFELPNNTSFKS